MPIVGTINADGSVENIGPQTEVNSDTQTEQPQEGHQSVSSPQEAETKTEDVQTPESDNTGGGEQEQQPEQPIFSDPLNRFNSVDEYQSFVAEADSFFSRKEEFENNQKEASTLKAQFESMDDFSKGYVELRNKNASQEELNFYIETSINPVEKMSDKEIVMKNYQIMGLSREDAEIAFYDKYKVSKDLYDITNDPEEEEDKWTEEEVEAEIRKQNLKLQIDAKKFRDDLMQRQARKLTPQATVSEQQRQQQLEESRARWDQAKSSLPVQGYSIKSKSGFEFNYSLNDELQSKVREHAARLGETIGNPSQDSINQALSVAQGALLLENFQEIAGAAIDAAITETEARVRAEYNDGSRQTGDKKEGNQNEQLYGNIKGDINKTRKVHRNHIVIT